MSAAESKPKRAPAAQLFPGRMVRWIVAAALILLIIVRSTELVTDIAVINVLTLVLGFIAGLSLLVWFVGFSAYPPLTRLLTAAVLILAVAIATSLFRIEGVSGSLIPRLVYRFAPDKDFHLDKVAVEEGAGVDLAATADGDFPQFLGPDRNAVIKNVRLTRDWDEDPPTLLWKQPIGAGWSGFAAVNGFAVTLEQRGDEELVTCYEAMTGKLRWSHAERGRHQTVMGGIGPRSTPTIHKGRVFATIATGVALCLDGATGNVVWRVDLVTELGSDQAAEQSEIAWGRAGSPLIVDELVVYPGGGRPGKSVSLIAFGQSDGEIVWQAGNRQISYASPTLVTLCGVRQILSVNEDNVSAHDPKTGKILWEEPWPGDSSGAATAAQPLTPGNDLVLVAKGYSVGGKLFQVSKSGDSFATEVLWEKPRSLLTKFTNAAIVNGYAYALSDGVLECVELESGDTMWKGKRRRLGDYGQGQLLAVGEVLLVQAENGEVVMVEATPDKLNELARFPALTGQTWNTLCLHGELLLVRNAEDAACYRLDLAH